MNPPLTFDSALTELKTLTSQSGNFTFTDAELTQALQESWNDPFVCNKVTDTSVSFVAGTWQYALPATLNTVTGLRFTRTSTDFPEDIARDIWNYNAATNSIEFSLNAPKWLADTYQLYIDGRYKLTTSDSLGTTNLINYVLNLAAQKLLNRLLLKKTLVFLTNDTSVAEIVGALSVFRDNANRARQGLAREFESI